VRVPLRDLGERLPHAGDAEGEVAGGHDGHGEGAGHDEGDLHVHLHELQNVITRDAQLGHVGHVDQPVVKPLQTVGHTQEPSLRLENLPAGERPPAGQLHAAPLTHPFSGKWHRILPAMT